MLVILTYVSLSVKILLDIIAIIDFCGQGLSLTEGKGRGYFISLQICLFLSKIDKRFIF